MKEMDNGKVPRNSAVSFRSPLNNLLSKPTKYEEALLKSTMVSKMKSEIFHSKGLFTGNPPMHDNFKVLDELRNCNSRSGTNRENDRIRDSFPIKNDVEVSDLCIQNFQEENRENTVKETAISLLRSLFSDICKMILAVISSPSETFIDIIPSESLRNRHCSDEANTSIPIIKHLDKESKASAVDTVKDGSPDNNLEKSTNVINFSESDFDISFPCWRISGCDTDENFTTKRISKKPLRYRAIQSYLNNSYVNDFMEWYSKIFTNPTNYDKENPATFRADENWDGGFPFESYVVPKKILKFSDSDSGSSNSTLKFSQSESVMGNYDLNILKSESEFGNCDSKLSIRGQEPAVDRQLVRENLTAFQNLINTIAEFPFIVQDANISAEKLSGPDFSVGNGQRNPFNTTNLKSEVSTDTDNVLVHLKFLISSNYLNQILKKLSGSNPILCERLGFVDTDSDSNNSDFRVSNNNKESNSVKQLYSEYDKEGDNLFKQVMELEYGRKIGGRNRINCVVEDDERTSFFTDDMKNEITKSMNTNNALARLNAAICPRDSRKTLKKQSYSNSNLNKPIFINTESHQSGSKISKRKAESSPDETSRKYESSNITPTKPLFISTKTFNFDFNGEISNGNEESAKPSTCNLSSLLTSDNARGNSTRYVESEDNDPYDIFKIVVKCHPIKKFEIPPYATAGVERTLDIGSGNLQDSGTKWNPSQLFGIDGNRNISECVSGIDSHSRIVLDISDGFRENSNLICNALIEEYLSVAAKVNFLLIKGIKNISTEERDLRLRTLYSLYDELEYVSAKLITTRNGWIKQFLEIEDNIERSRNDYRDTYHVGILTICIILATILIRFSIEKQLKLEEYENDLRCYH